MLQEFWTIFSLGAPDKLGGCDLLIFGDFSFSYYIVFLSLPSVYF